MSTKEFGSRRELILQDIVRVLDAVNGTGLYSTNVKDVKRILKALDELNKPDMPVFMVIAGTEAEEEQCSGWIDSEFSVIIWGGVYDPMHKTEALERLIADCKIAIRTDVHRGTYPSGGRLADNTVLVSAQPFEGEIQPWEAVRFEWQVQYRYQHLNP